MSDSTRFNCLKFSSLFILLLIFQNSHSQYNKKNTKELGLDAYAELDGMVKRQSKALGEDLVAMVWTDTLRYKHELGELDSKTVAPLGAASSLLTAALVLKIAEEGKISLDDKVAQYIPLFETYGKSYITLRHCLTHFTGIQAEGKLFSKKKFGSLEDEVNSYAKKEIQTNPGTEFRYSEIGPAIAGRVLEIVTKKKFDMLIKQKLFNPLGMRKSTFGNLDGSSIDPASDAQSSADEMIRFLQMLLNNGIYNGQPFLSEESMKELRKVHTTPGLMQPVPKTVTGYAYALGSWATGEGKDGQALAISAASLSGTWAEVDWCRGYAFLVITKSEKGEQKKDVYTSLEASLEDKHPAKCL